jgi:hypothetical protein
VRGIQEVQSWARVPAPYGHSAKVGVWVVIAEVVQVAPWASLTPPTAQENSPEDYGGS